MSLRTQINGFTAWINLRLVPYGSLLENVLVDLIKGNHYQQLLHSLTAKSLKKIQSFEGLTQQQKVTRIEWFVAELKKSEVLPENVKIDARLVGQKVADHVFDLLWRLVSHDIWFTWERMEYLQNNDPKILSEIPFQWTPEPPPKKKRRRVVKTTESMLMGFGGSSQVVESHSPSPDALPEGYEPFPGSEKVKSFKPHRPKGGWYSYPSPDDCILDMINSQLETVTEGRNLTVYSLDDLVDSRVLCGLINSFVPGTFTTELMLNDRWTINLALKTIGEMLRASNPMGAEDVSEADPKSLCSFLCFFFMCSFKLKQSKAVIQRLKDLKLLIREQQSELAQFPEQINSRQDLRAKQDLEASLQDCQREQEILNDTYDIAYINDWLEFVQKIQEDTRKTVAEKMKIRFDLVHIPRHMTINELCMAQVINLQLTQGSGFYRVYEHENCTPDRRIVLRDKKKKIFLDDFTGAPGQKNIRDHLCLPRDEVIMLEQEKYPEYECYIESMSRNKTLHAGSTFLYQVFPGNTAQWQRMFFKAAKEGDEDIVTKMVVFFEKSHPDFITSREANFGNTVLHTAARNGHFNLCRYLLRNGCSVNAKNDLGCTPLFSAAEGLHKRVATLLIEWGCNAKVKNVKCQTAFDVIRNEDMKKSLQSTSEYWVSAVQAIVKGNNDTLGRVIEDHVKDVHKMVDPESRCIFGSTLLHTAAHFSQKEPIENLLKARVDVNLRDYQGATPLHRAKELDVVKLLLDSNADIGAADSEGNTALHVQCYGENNMPSFLDGISYMMSQGVDFACRNSRMLMPIHCAAMQGRQDVIEFLLDSEEEEIRAEIEKEGKRNPPSLPYLAVAGDHLNCAKWLVERGIFFKSGETDRVMYKLLTEQLAVNDRAMMAKFLLDNDASINLKYEGGDTILHLAVQMSGSTDVLEILLESGAKVNSVNAAKSTALFYAAQLNKFYAANLLINRGANVHLKNGSGLTAFDFIHDFDEWMACGFFSDEVLARLKAYQFKHARELIRGISKKIKTESKLQQAQMRRKDDEWGRRLIQDPRSVTDNILDHFRKRLKIESPELGESRPGTMHFMKRPRFVPRRPSPGPIGSSPTPSSPTPMPSIRVKIRRNLVLRPAIQSSI